MNNQQELGNIQIFFGKVTNVIDDKDKLNRCQVSIPGYTDQIEDPTTLPWYFPWYGLNYLPLIDDTVSVIVFDGNFSTAFYGRKIDLTSVEESGELEDGDYENYLEIFKRQVGEDNVQLTYKTSTGIEFVNGEVKTQIELDKYSMFCLANSIVMTEDRIDIGNSGLEAVLQGDKAVTHLHNIITHQNNMIAKMFQGFRVIQGAATNPFTSPIAGALAGFIPSAQPALVSENSRVDAEADTIQSEMVFTNE